MGVQLDMFGAPLTPPATPAEEPCLTDEIEVVLERINKRVEEDNAEIRALHAKIVGVPVEDLDRFVAQREADQKAARAEAKPRVVVPALPRTSKRTASKSPIKPASSMRRLTDRQQELLSCLVIDGDRAVFGPNDKIDDWAALKEVMVALGSKWKTGGKKKGAFIFPEDVDAAETLRLAQEHGEIFDATLVGFFASPPTVASYAASKLDTFDGMRVLEPSAGLGALALAVFHACPTAIIDCVELLPEHRRELATMGFTVIGDNFDEFCPNDHEPYDAVLMNPPFGNGAEAHHVLHAAKCVIPGGQVVAIVSQGVTFRQTSPYVELARWLKAHGTIEDLPDGSFKESGTMIKTALITAKTCGWCRTGTCWER